MYFPVLPFSITQWDIDSKRETVIHTLTLDTGGGLRFLWWAVFCRLQKEDRYWFLPPHTVCGVVFKVGWSDGHSLLFWESAWSSWKVAMYLQIEYIEDGYGAYLESFTGTVFSLITSPAPWYEMIRMVYQRLQFIDPDRITKLRWVLWAMSIKISLLLYIFS